MKNKKKEINPNDCKTQETFLKTIEEALKEFEDKMWYDRSMMIKDDKKTDKKIMKQAEAARKRIESKYGKKNLGPHTDYEWGEICGKVSALRWVLGDEWDNLDS